MLQTIYEITQQGKSLICDKIILNKYENKVTILHFNIDDSLSNTRLYVALLNPVTKKYTISPLSLNDSIILGSGMTIYPGIWELILLATRDDYEITDDNIDNSKLCYVSNTLKRVVVRDNFLSEEQIELEDNPAIDQLLDETVAMRDQLENWAVGAKEDALTASESATEAKNAAQIVLSAIEAYEKSLEEIQELIKNYTTSGNGDKYLTDKGTYAELITSTELNEILEVLK